jgi:N-acetylglutamate synthase-like GNAT family acetyltransferase
MIPTIEIRRENLLISTDPARLDLDAIADMLSRAYWAKGRKPEVIARSIQHSLVFGIYDGAKQIGFARVISDYTTFAWLCDVIIHEDYRGSGLGKWLVETILSHPELKDVARFRLVTQDAHGLYAQYGFNPIPNPEQWMEKLNG